MKSYFHFSRRQKIGVTSLFFIIVFLIVILNVNNSQGLPDAEIISLNQIEFAKVDSINPSKKQYTDQKFKSDRDQNTERNYNLFKFDPNKLNQSGWEDLGFSDKQASSILNYRSKFGPFQNANDVSKIYVISKEKFDEIEPYMQFDSTVTESVSVSQIDINNADSKDLEALKGIGPYYAEQIIKYREMLGGFVRKEQFKEVYGLSDLAVESLNKQATIDLSLVKKININTASKEAIKNHPYFKNKWEVVAVIIKKRSISAIENLDFLVDKKLMSKQEIQHVSPYIMF